MKQQKSLLLTVLLLGSANGYAQIQSLASPQRLQGTKSNALGGASLSSNLGAESIYTNPSVVANTKQYSVGLSYLGSGELLGASILDTKSGPVGGGVYYLRSDTRTSGVPELPEYGNTEQLEERAGVVAMIQASPQLSISGAAKYAYVRPSGEGLPYGKNWNGDLSATIRFSNQWIAAMSAQNILEDLMGVHPKSVLGSLQFVINPALSFSAQVQKLVVSSIPETFTIVNANDPWTYSAGLTWNINPSVALMAGYRDSNPWSQSWASAGVSYLSEQFGIDYSFQYESSGTAATLHNLGLSASF